MSKIIVALDNIADGKAWEDAVTLAQKLSGKVWGFKLNDALHCGHYWSARLNQLGKLMFDPKLYDIPTTMRNTVNQMLPRGPNFITVHASAGEDSLKAAVEAAGNRAKIIAVTVLTSFTPKDCLEMFGCDRKKAVSVLAGLAERAGVYGLVCATDDLPFLSKMTDLIKICPGIRPDGLLAGDDQQAIGLGKNADLVVVGRLITQADDPVGVVEKLNKLYGE